MFFIASLPTLLYLFIIYNAVVFISPAPVTELLQTPIFEISMLSGSSLAITGETFFIVSGILLLYIEIFKSTRINVESMLEQALSMLMFIVFLMEFMMFERAGTHTFFILTLLQLVDVMAGFTVTVSTARRDIMMGD